MGPSRHLNQLVHMFWVAEAVWLGGKSTRTPGARLPGFKSSSSLEERENSGKLFNFSGPISSIKMEIITAPAAKIFWED